MVEQDVGAGDEGPLRNNSAYSLPDKPILVRDAPSDG